MRSQESSARTGKGGKYNTGGKGGKGRGKGSTKGGRRGRKGGKGEEYNSRGKGGQADEGEYWNDGSLVTEEERAVDEMSDEEWDAVCLEAERRAREAAAGKGEERGRGGKSHGICASLAKSKGRVEHTE